MYCHILRVRAILTLESTNSMIVTNIHHKLYQTSELKVPLCVIIITNGGLYIDKSNIELFDTNFTQNCNKSICAYETRATFSGNNTFAFNTEDLGAITLLGCEVYFYGNSKSIGNKGKVNGAIAARCHGLSVEMSEISSSCLHMGNTKCVLMALGQNESMLQRSLISSIISYCTELHVTCI